MKKIYLALLAMAALAAASCTEKEELALSTGEKVTREFSTVLTKTSLHSDGKTVYWEEDDAISIFDGTDNNKFDIQDYDNGSPSASATFKGEVDGGATDFYAVYPYAAGNTLSGTTVTANVPSSQTLKAGTFTSGAAVAVAYTKGSSLAFHNATAILGITLESYMTDVESIEFSGNTDEYVAGPVSATLNSSGAVSSIAPGTGSKTVTLTGTFVAGETYYLSFIPQTFSNGVRVIVTFDDGKTAIATSSKKLVAEAGVNYPIANFTRVSLPVATFAEKNSFNYDSGAAQSLAPLSSANIASISVDSAPEGWDIAWDTDHFAVTPPTQAEIQAVPQTVAPEGTFEVILRSAAGHTRQVAIPVRLYGINSLADWDAFRTAYGPANDGIGKYTSGTSYSARGTAAADYMVSDEITLNADITPAAATNYYFHNIEHSFNGNGRTLTINVNGNEWPIGFCQQTYGNPVIHDLNLAGTVNWSYNATVSTAGVASAFAGKVAAGTLSFVDVNSSVNITWTSEGVYNTDSKHHAVGGLVGSSTGFTVKFTNCSNSGTIAVNCRALAIGGFIGWSSGANKTYFDGCSFSGNINATASSDKVTAYGANANLDYIGGFVGATDANASALIQIKGSTMSGKITVANGAKMVGGFVGKASCPLSIVDDDSSNHSIFSGTIDYTDAAGVVSTTAYGYVGGFIGSKTASSTTISNCVSTSSSEVKVTGGAQRVGGFIGGTDVAFNSFSNNTFGGKVTYASAGAVVAASIERVGGFVGHMGGAGSTFSSNHSAGVITVTQGAMSVGGFCGIDAGNDSYSGCDYSGTLDFTSYTTLPTDGEKANKCGRIGGFVGELSTNTVNFSNCNVTSSGVVTSKYDVSCSAGFLGQGGATASGNSSRGTANFTDCNFHGTLSHDWTTNTTGTGAHRSGGFVGDASRVVSLTSCSNDGTIILYDRGRGWIALGGIIGRTTNAVDGHTMSCTLSSCTYSGTMIVYAPNSTRATNLSGSTNIFGTLIGANAATTAGVLTIDGANYTTTAVNNNYGSTSVTFSVEP